MQLDLADGEASALPSLLNRVIADDRYPLSPRIRLLRAIRVKLPGAPPEPPRPRDRRRPKNVREGERHASAGHGAKRHASGGLLTLPSSFFVVSAPQRPSDWLLSGSATFIIS